MPGSKTEKNEREHSTTDPEVRNRQVLSDDVLNVHDILIFNNY